MMQGHAQQTDASNKSLNNANSHHASRDIVMAIVYFAYSMVQY